jgi:hypothetical protein
MARKINTNSTRQLAFVALDALMTTPRGEAVDSLMAEFSIGKAYAKTLYQNHRATKKDEGAFKTVFVVRDKKDGRPVAPHMTASYVMTVPQGSATTEAAAVKSYVADLNRQVKVAEKLVVAKKPAKKRPSRSKAAVAARKAATESAAAAPAS